jgi:ABC-type multidrug transport system fused ATPase/permease subunit
MEETNKTPKQDAQKIPMSQILYGDNEHPEEHVSFEELESFEQELKNEEVDREFQRRLKEELFKEREMKLEKQRKSVGLFKILYFKATCKDKVIIFFAFLGAFALGGSMPLFAILFGNTINGLGPSNTGLGFLDNISDLCLKFIYVAIGMFFAGTLMVWLWTLSCRIILRKLKEEYFAVIMRQEQKWFDETDPYQFATKIQTQCTSIENGVNVFLNLAW